MLTLIVTNKVETQQLSHPTGPIEVGRGPGRPGVTRVVIKDAFVSRDHLRIEEKPGRKVRVENLSTRVGVAVDGHSVLSPGLGIEHPLPVRLAIGETVIDVDGDGPDPISDNLLRTVAAPVRGDTGHQPSLMALSQSAPIEEVVGWLETVVAVQKATGPNDFYQQTAAALVDRIGLDCGMVMVRDGETFRVVANASKDGQAGHGRAFSQTILKRVMTDKRTFYTPTAAVGADSLIGVQGVVASPIFDTRDEVVGVVYGTRAQKIRSREVGPLEAQVVQLLAAAVGAGLSRFEQDAEASRLRVAKEAAEEADRTKSQFLAMVSHELRTPLTTIIGYSEMLLEDVQAEGQTQYVDNLNQVHTAGQHLLRLINDILDLSKIQANKMDLAKDPYDPATLVRDLMVSCEPLAKKNANTLVVDCPPDLGRGVGDPTRIRQCVLNLLANACKFTERGTVTVAARRMMVSGVDSVTIEVSDTGIGMTPEQMTRLFEPFTQVDSTAGRKYGGTGLGLAISQKLCQAMGGKLLVESEYGRGSTFTMQIQAVLG